MKVLELGPAVLDRALGAVKGIHARAKALATALDDILKTLVNAAFFLFVEYERARTSESKVQMEEATRRRLR